MRSLYHLVLKFIFILLNWIDEYGGLNNGLLMTPPMGWLAWERFKCNIDCLHYPKDCISENLFMEMANRLVEDGYKDAGYDRINIDDCWMEQHRNKDGQIQESKDRFPKGISWLASYMHERGIKLGIYGDFGQYTCMGYPGIVFSSMKADITKFAKFEVDMLKLDGCHSKLEDLNNGYIAVGKYLNKTCRPIVYSCSWPYYQMINNIEPDFNLITKHCNLWRNYHDITDTWASIKSVIDFYGDNQEVLVPNAGPGHWNDPDMLLIGNPGLSYEQSKLQMAMWAILAAPLLMSNDLRSIHPELKEILLNKQVIAINQDKLGIQGKRIFKDENKGIEIWARPITPVWKDRYSFAIGILNSNLQSIVRKVTFCLKNLGLSFEHGYHIHDLFSNEDMKIYFPSSLLQITVKPTSIVLLRANLNL